MAETDRLHEKMLAMNEALVVGLVRQHELIDVADTLNVGLEKEIAERRLAEAALRESEARYRALFELGPVAVYSCDAAGLIQNFNRRAADLWKRRPVLGDEQDRFCGSAMLRRPDESPLPHDQCSMADVLSGRVAVVRDAEVLIEREDGSRVTVVVNIVPLKDAQGNITGAINCFYDITERKEAEQRQRFLMDELAHRSQNLLAVVLAVAARSLTGTRPIAEEREILAQRIQALSRSQAVLVSGGFEGAPVAAIVGLGLEGFSDRVTAAGPAVMLNRRVAQTFSLVVHELATNAAKYGALSVPGGQVAVGWSIEGEGAEARFRFQWRESGGPAVVPPTRRGFGSILIEKAAGQDFAALPTLTFAADGLLYRIDAPLAVLTASIEGERPYSGDLMNRGTEQFHQPGVVSPRATPSSPPIYKV